VKTEQFDNRIFPPRLTMDNYAVFISENMESAEREQIRIQKEIEEHISKRFCIPDDI